MWQIAAGLIGSGIAKGIGGLLGGKSQADAYKEAMEKANGQLDTTMTQNRSDWSPYTTAGKTAIGKLTSDVTGGTGVAKGFNMGDFYSDPGYQFTLQQGTNAINNSAAAKGGLLSGGAVKSLANYGTGLANQTFGDAYNRYLSTRQQGVSELMGIAGMGESATGSLTGQTTQLGGQKADNTFNALSGAGNARGAGIASAFGGVSSGLNNLAQYYADQDAQKKSKYGWGG